MTKYLSYFIFSLLLISVFLSIFSPLIFESVISEDGIIEWLTFFLLLGVAFKLAVISLMSSNGKIYFLYQIIIVLFGAFEEISWGQRIFLFNTPEFFKTYNIQGELNFHNLIIGGIKLNKLIFGKILSLVVVLYFTLFPILARNYKWLQIYKISIPSRLNLIQALIIFILVSLVPSSKKGELLEFGMCGLMLVIVLQNAQYLMKPESKNNKDGL